MAMKTPDWIIEGFDSKADWEKKKGIKPKKKGKTYKVRSCPKCGSGNVGVVLVEDEGKKADKWECYTCKWNGKDVKVEEFSEDEFLEKMEKEK